MLVDTELSGTVIGATLATRAEEVYRALFESTAYGTRKIVETFNAAGVPVTEFIAAGGLIRNPVLMQIYSDVLRMPVSIIASAQGPALGSAMHAAVAAGEYATIRDAADAMGKCDTAVYTPDPAAADAYDALYREYDLLHDYFGRGANDVMHRLKTIRREALT